MWYRTKPACYAYKWSMYTLVYPHLRPFKREHDDNSADFRIWYHSFRNKGLYRERERTIYIYIPKSESNPPKIENWFLTILVGFCIVVFLLGWCYEIYIILLSEFPGFKGPMVRFFASYLPPFGKWQWNISYSVGWHCPIWMTMIDADCPLSHVWLLEVTG